MEFFLDVGVRKERFPDLGTALERAVALCADAQCGGGPVPVGLSDTGERHLLGEAEIARVAAIAGKTAPVGDQVAHQVFAPLSDDTLDDLCCWLAFRMRTAGIANRQRLAIMGAILDAGSPNR